MNKKHILLALVLPLFTFFSLTGYAQEETAATDSSDEVDMSAEDAAYLEQIKAIWDNLDRQTGTISLPGGFATLDVPDTFYYLNPRDAEIILADVWGNPPGSETLGMLFPERYTPFDEESWAVTIEYIDDGYVSDEDAADINYDKMLKQMKKDTARASKERKKAGYGEMELVGWAEQPFYSHDDKHLYWAKDLVFDGDVRVLNYDIRALGRKGVLSMTFVANSEQLSEVNGSRQEVLDMIVFNEGFRYEDYEPGNDKLAAYGVGALVAGAVAKKAGLIAGLLLLLKKFGVFIVIGIAAFFGKIKSALSKEPKS